MKINKMLIKTLTPCLCNIINILILLEDAHDEKNDINNLDNQQQFTPVQNYSNMNMNLNGDMSIEKKGELGKIAIILMTAGILLCGLGVIPGIICAFIAFIKDRHNATNIAAFIIAIIETLIIVAFTVGYSEDINGINNKTSVESSISKHENKSKSQVKKNKVDKKEKKTYHIGDSILVKTDEGSYSLRITGVRETSDRNEFSDTKADRVVIIDYKYKNISQSDDELYISDMDFSMYDADGEALETYPADTKEASGVSVGHKSSGQMAYALNNNKNYIEAEYSDNFLMGSDFTIILKW